MVGVFDQPSAFIEEHGLRFFEGNAMLLGIDSCLTFIGRTYELLGKRKEAADYFRKALAMHPADHLAKEGLKRVSEKK